MPPTAGDKCVCHPVGVQVQEAEQAPALTSHLGVFNPTGQLSCSPASTPPEVLHPVSDTRKLEGSRNQLQPCPSLQGGASQEQSVRLLGCCDSKGQHAGPNTRPVLRCYHDIPGPTLPRILRTTPSPPAVWMRQGCPRSTSTLTLGVADVCISSKPKAEGKQRGFKKWVPGNTGSPRAALVPASRHPPICGCAQSPRCLPSQY